MQERNDQEIFNLKTTRFLDDEYPTLHSGVSRDQKIISSNNYRSGKLSNHVGNTKHRANNEKIPCDSDGYTISENESASEWETEDEECLYTKRRFDTVQELGHSDTQCEGLKDNSITHLEFESDNYSQPKSILRRKCNDPESKLANSGKCVGICPPPR